MRRLIPATIFLVCIPDGVHALLCARRDGTVASRAVCKRHEAVVPIAPLLPSPPAPRPMLATVRDTPVALSYATHVSQVAALTYPTPNPEPYTVLATIYLVNHRAVADTITCPIVVQGTGRNDLFGLQIGGGTVMLDGASSTAVSLIARLPPNLTDAALQNGIGAIALGCWVAPESEITATGASLAAWPFDLQR